MLANLRPLLEDVARRGVFILAAAVLGVVGLLVLAAAIAAMLAEVMPWPAALIVTALVFVGVAAVALWLGVRSNAEPDEESEGEAGKPADLETIAEMFPGMPVEAARRLIQDRPLAAVALASTVGVLLARKPEAAVDLMQKYFLSDLDRF